MPNFGDRLAPQLLAALLGRPLVHVESGEQRLVTLGSLCHLLAPRDLVWGTGTLAPIQAIPPGVRVFATRGPLTRESLRRLGQDVPEVYGDPAQLGPRLLGWQRRPIEREWLFIPHWSERETLPHLPGVDIADPTSDPEELVAQIASAAFVCSSALHPIIVAEAIGIPACWASIRPPSLGTSPFKFHDYYLATGRKALAADWSQGIDRRQAEEVARQLGPPIWDPQPLWAAWERVLECLSRLESGGANGE